MKGFPPNVDGPLGPWYQKVNAAIREATESRTIAELRDILGEPDAIEAVEDDDRRETKDAPVDEKYPEQYWVYRDPYRPRFYYYFGISRGRPIELYKEARAS
jgi:hypothetical protein